MKKNRNEQKIPPRDKQNSVVFPTASILLQMIQNEYDIESARKRDLEIRTGILIALLGALIGFYTNAIDFSFFKIANTKFEYLCFIFISIIYIFPLICFLLSMKKFINVLQAKTYQRIGINGINEDIARKPVDKISIKMAESYRVVVENNIFLNEEKAVEYNKGIILLYISLIGVIVAFLLKHIIFIII